MSLSIATRGMWVDCVAQEYLEPLPPASEVAWVAPDSVVRVRGFSALIHRAWSAPTGVIDYSYQKGELLTVMLPPTRFGAHTATITK
ncbi:MAG: hypothetical protein U0165_07295 [Polyangiaceae bacterium]